LPNLPAGNADSFLLAIYLNISPKEAMNKIIKLLFLILVCEGVGALAPFYTTCNYNLVSNFA